jgi:hypothetical protein
MPAAFAAEHLQLPATTSCVSFIMRNRQQFPAAEVRKQNILGATYSVAMSWESVIPVVIKNLFAKYGVGPLRKARNEEAEENDEWVELQGHMDCPSNFDEYINVYKSIPTTNY